MKNSWLLFLIFFTSTLVTENFDYALNNEINQTITKESVSLSAEQKVEDFDYLFHWIEENSPLLGPMHRKTGKTWDELYQEYYDQVEATNNDESYFEVLNMLMDELHNGHSHVLDSFEEYEVYREAYLSTNNIFYLPWKNAITNAKVQSRYASRKNENVDYPFIVGNTNTKLPPKIDGDGIAFQADESLSTAYVEIQTFGQQYFELNKEKLETFAKDIENYDHLIIDIRNNHGGSSEYWQYLVSLLIEEPLSYTTYLGYRGSAIDTYLEDKINLEPVSTLPLYEKYADTLYSDLDKVSEETYTVRPDMKGVPFKGDIYLLVDDNVYSSAETFAYFSKYTGFATLIGEQTRGDGIGFDPVLLPLPNSGFLVRTVIQTGINLEGKLSVEEGTTPDIAVSGENAKEEAIHQIESADQ